jgi:RNA polymerase sigma factor (sigma-70 family)
VSDGAPAPPGGDGEWLAALRRREPAAFARLFERFAEPLYRRVLLPRLGSRAAAEDALAETFRKAIERSEQFEERGQGIWGWLAAIAANQARDLHREAARSGRVLANFSALLEPLEDARAAAASVEGGWDERRLQQRVTAVLGALRPRYRRAIELRFLEQRSREQCAELLEVKVATFDVVLLRSLRAFRKAWGDAVGGSPESAP